jgi:Fe(3+) dicitrate transport protein
VNVRAAAALLVALGLASGAARAQDVPPGQAPPEGKNEGEPAGKEKGPGPRAGLQEEVDRYLDEKGRETARPVVGVDEIVVSADREVPLTYPGGRDVIDRNTLDAYPDASVSTVLRRVPGVFVLPENGNDSRAAFGIRGNDPRRSGLTTLLVDGIPICEAPYGNTDVDGLPIAMERIWRIDVIRGGASIRYGPNSAGGVINFLTEPVPEKAVARASLRFGSDGDWAATAVAGGTSGSVGVLATAVRKGGDGFRENSAYDDLDGSLKFRWKIDDADTLSWSVSRFLELDAEQPGGLTQAAYDRDPDQSLRDGADFRFDANLYVVQYQHEVGPGSAFQLIGWWQDGFRGLFDFRPILRPFTVERVQESVFSSGALEARYTWNRTLLGLPNSFFHSARYLVERNDEFYWRRPLAGGPKNTPYDLHAIFKGRAFSLFTEDTVALSDAVDWAAGCRVESIVMEGRSRDTGLTVGKDYGLFLPETSLTWTVRPRTALYGSWQRNFYAPQYETGFDPASVLYAPTKPEHSETVEAGLRSREWEGVELTAAWFMTSFRDKIDFVNLPSGTKLAVNSGQARIRGVEAGASWDLGKRVPSLAGVSVYGTFTQMRSRIESGPNDGNDTPDAPRRLASWGARYDHSSGLWVRAGGSYCGKSFKDLANTPVGTADGVNGPVPAFTLWDCAAGWRQRPDGTGFSASVGVTNLLDEAYFRRFSTGIFPGAPRQLFAVVAYGVEF